MEDRTEDFEEQRRRLSDQMDEMEYRAKRLNDRKEDFILRRNKDIASMEDAVTYINMDDSMRRLYNEATEEMRMSKQVYVAELEAAEEELQVQKRKCQEEMADLDKRNSEQ